MSYITPDELSTHLYGEVTEEISRNDNVLPYPTLNDFPLPGDPLRVYIATDTALFYKWVYGAYAAINYKSPLQVAIDAAEAEAFGYLMAYDTVALGLQTGDNRNPILSMYIKDIAVWHYIQLSNPGVDMQLRMDRYEKAIQWLVKVQRGDTNPSLPLPASVEGQYDENFFRWGANDKLTYNF